MQRPTRRLVLGGGLAAPALAQIRTDRPVELVVGFSAGGGTDITARAFARFLEPRLGQPVAVVNRPGAAGEVGLAAVARGRADGSVIGMTNMPSVVTIPIERSAQFSLDGFAWLGNLVTDPTGIVVAADDPARDLPALIEAARAAPEQIAVSTSGIGTDDHLMMVQIERATGARFTLVHFPGAPQQRTALLGRQVRGNMLSVGEVLPNPQGLRALGYAAASRSRFAPEVPTLREQGLDIAISSERGLVAPAGTPAPVLVRLRAAVAEACADPECRRAFEAQFTEPAYEAPGPWEARLRRAQEEYRALWRAAPWIVR